MFTTALFMAALTSSPALAANPPPPTLTAQHPYTYVYVAAQPRVLQLTLPVAPPTRTTCSVVRVGTTPASVINPTFDGQETLAVWDPQDAGLTTRVKLATPGYYTVRCWGTPTFRATNLGPNKYDLPLQLDFKVSATNRPIATSAVDYVDATGLDLLVDKVTSAGTTVAAVQVGKLSLALTAYPSLSDVAGSLTATRPPSSDGRSGLLGAVPPLLADTLEILAEIVVERAKKQAFEFVMAVVSDTLCEKLVLPKSEGLELVFPSHIGKPVLPGTCEAVRAIRLPDLANAGPALARAVQGDIVSLITDAVTSLFQQQTAKQAVASGSNASELGAVLDILTPLVEADPLNFDASVLSEKVFTALFDTTLFSGTEADCLRKVVLPAAVKAVLNPAATMDLSACPAAQQATVGRNAARLKAELLHLRELGAATRDALSAVKGAPSDAARAASTGLEQSAQAAQAVVAVARTLLDIAAADPSVTPDKLTRTKSIVDRLGRVGIAAQVIERVVPMVIDLAQQPESLDIADAQALIVSLSQVDWGHAGDGRVQEAATAMQLVFATIATCQSSRGCDAAQVVELIEKPETWLQDKIVIPRELRPQLVSLVQRGLEVLAAPRTGGGRDQIRASVKFAFDVITLVAKAEALDPDAPGAAIAASAIPRAQKIALALVDGETQTILTESSGLLVTVVDQVVSARIDACAKDTTKCTSIGPLVTVQSAMQRVTPLVATLVANARSLTTAAGTPEERAQLRDARKQALEDLIDANTNRAHRGGNWVVSLGVPVGFNGGFNFGNNARLGAFGLSAPFGAGVQQLALPRRKLADTAAKSVGCGQASILEGARAKWGYHFFVGVFDLGHFIGSDGLAGTTDAKSSDAENTSDALVPLAELKMSQLADKDAAATKAVDKLVWQDIVHADFQIGFMPPLGRYSPSNLVFGVESKIYPGATVGQKAGTPTAYVGAFVSWYVPIFDIN